MYLSVPRSSVVASFIHFDDCLKTEDLQFNLILFFDIVFSFLVFSHPNRILLIYEGRTESHEQLFLHANWEQQTKESAVVDGTSCCVILECLVTSIACIV